MKQLSLVRGVESFPVDRKIDINEAISQAIEILTEHSLVKKGDRLVYVGGIPMKKREPVNTINITTNFNKIYISSESEKAALLK